MIYGKEVLLIVFIRNENDYIPHMGAKLYCSAMSLSTGLLLCV